MEPEELIPDFDDMEKWSHQAAALKGRLVGLKANLSMYEAQTIYTAMTNQDFWIGNKRPGITYCQAVVAKIGNTDIDRQALFDWRRELADTVEELTLVEHLIDIAKAKLDLYRTLSANTRKSFL